LASCLKKGKVKSCWFHELLKMRILIVKIGAIGDVVMSLPLLSSLRKQYPNATITWVCGKRVAPLLEATKKVDRIVLINETKLLKGSFFEKLLSVVFLWWQIGCRTYDLSLRLHADIRYKAIDWPIFCKNRKSWSKHSHPVPGSYHALECLALHQNDPNAKKYEFPSLHLPSSNFMADVLIAPGGAKNVLADDFLRRWPIEHYVELIRRLKKHSLKIAVIGSKEDEWVFPYLQGLSIENWMGKFSLLELIACMKNSRLLITHDSGPLHLAKLVQCPTVALFGPTNPLEKVGSSELVKVFWGGAHLACRPCYNGKTFARCTDNLCLSSIAPETIYQESMRKLLEP
jgi:ADP-heptose:LPS heptosyltransferase